MFIENLSKMHQSENESVTWTKNVVVDHHLTIVASGHGLLNECIVYTFGKRLRSTHCREFYFYFYNHIICTRKDKLVIQKDMFGSEINKDFFNGCA